MPKDTARQGYEELRDARVQCRAQFWVVGVFSLFANLLMLTGPVYMLQVYDRVLSSGSIETLVALSALMVFLYAMMGLLDFVRNRIMIRVGVRFYQTLQARVFHAVMRKAAVLSDRGQSGGMQDLGAVQTLISAPVVIAAYDIPWTPLFFAMIFVFHPLLGALAVGGAMVLILMALANQMLSRRSRQAGVAAGVQADAIFHHVQTTAETVEAMGMRQGAYLRWRRRKAAALAGELRAVETGSGFSAATKTLRLLLQSGMLGLGAFLVIGGQMTPGGMIAGSILLGRALSPVEMVLNQWAVVQQGLHSWHALGTLLEEVPRDAVLAALPRPQGFVSVKSVTVVPPGERVATLKSISFGIEPGQALGVIGPSGSGKSSLARAMVGVWPPVGGHIRLDGATLAHFDAESRGRYIGYLPQRVDLFEGGLIDNIARLSPEPEESKVIVAAKMAGAHDMILGLPEGYDTQIDPRLCRLSGGQLQRIGLARALYGDPVLVVLDEPNANLDHEGSTALNGAIRQMKQRGQAVMVMAHRPAAIQECDMLLVLEGGMRTAFGPKQEVLAGMVKNAGSLQAVPKAAQL